MNEMKYIAATAFLIALILYLRWPSPEHSQSIELGTHYLNPPASQKNIEQKPALEPKEDTISESPLVQDDGESPSKEVERYRDLAYAIKDRIPYIDEIRREAESNPHSTPESYLDFAEYLTPLMEQALKDPTKAEILFDELYDCVRSPNTTPNPVKLMCLANMKRLAETHPNQLEMEFEKARSVVDPELEDFLKFMKMER